MSGNNEAVRRLCIFLRLLASAVRR